MNGILTLIIFIFSIVIHEVSHGEVANSLGDPTAKDSGRLTLNPIKHLDPIGSIFVPLSLFFLTLPLPPERRLIVGWAKPVPINPYNFRDQKYGQAKVALAGPLANISIALFFGLLVRLMPSGIIFTRNLLTTFAQISLINLILAFFNLIPLPPLDGYHILFTFLPQSLKNVKIFLIKYGFFILIFLIYFFSQYFFDFVYLIFNLIAGLSY